MPNSSDTRTESTARGFAKLFFTWVQPLIDAGRRRPIGDADLFRFNATEDTKSCAHAFSETYKASATRRRPLLAALWAIHRPAFGMVSVLAAVNLVFVTLNPLVIREIVTALQSPTTRVSEGALLSCVLLGCVLVANLSVHHTFHASLKLGMRMRAGIVQAIYKKALRLTPEARHAASTGEVVNLMSNDAARIYNVAPMLHQLWAMPLQMIAIVALLFELLGVSMLAGLAVMVAMIFCRKASSR